MKIIDCPLINHHCDLTYNVSAKHTLVTMIVLSLIAKNELGSRCFQDGRLMIKFWLKFSQNIS
jgi:hypothetical protein